MIQDTINFICDQVSAFLALKLDLPDSDPILPGNIATLQDNQNSGNSNREIYSTFLSLVNIEEDRLSESQNKYRRQGNTLINVNPKVHLNLYILFAVNQTDYNESLKRLSLIIQCFQYRNVFTPQNSPTLPANTEKLIADLVTLSFQDLNNLWGILGSKYLPSVMYKVRMIRISDEFQQGNAPLIQEIQLNDQNLPA